MFLMPVLCNRIATAAMVPPNAAGLTAVGQALVGLSVCTTVGVTSGATDGFLRVPSLDDDDANVPEWNVAAIPRTLARTLVVPSLVEEVLWRVVLQPPGMSWWPHMMLVNVAFAAYHTVGSTALAERCQGRQGARAVFTNPAFLTLAFVLGNACSYAYVFSGYSLWAPVVTHALPVTLWLTLLGGDQALSTPGGLTSRRVE